MRRVARLLLWLTALLLAAVVAGIVAIVSIDPNQHKDWIAAKVLERTGRALSLEGDIAIGLYPWLELEVNGISLGNAPGFGDGVFLHADYGRLRVKTLPLLRNKYEIDTAQVRGARVNLARNEQGVANWEDLAMADEGAADAGAPGLAWAETLSAAIIGGVAVEDAKVVWDDRQAAARYEVSELNATVGELKYGEPIDLALSFRGRSDKPAVEAAVQLDGVVAYDLDGERYSVSPLNASAAIKSKHLPGGETAAGLSAVVEVGLDDETARVSDLELKGLGVVVRGRLSASRIASAAPSISADLEGQGADLALLFKVAEIEPLASQLARLRERGFQFSATAMADLERGDLELPEASARLLGATLAGAARARDLRSDAPNYQGKLKARGPDLPLLMQVLGQLQSGADAPLTRYGKKLAGRAAGAFEVAAEFDGDLKSGTVSIPVLSAQALGLAVAGELDAKNMQSRRGSVSGALQVSGSELAPLLQAFDQAELGQVLRAVKFNANIAGTRAGIALKPLTMEAVFAGAGIPNSPATIVMDADAALNLNADAATLKRVSLQGLGLALSGAAEARKLSSKPVFSGRFELQPFNLRQVAGQLQQPLPVVKDRQAFGRLALSGRFEGGDNKLHLSQLQAQLDDSLMTGEISLEGLSEELAIGFDLKVDELNADRYMPLAAARAEPAAARSRRPRPEAEVSAASPTPARVRGPAARSRPEAEVSAVSLAPARAEPAPARSRRPHAEAEFVVPVDAIRKLNLDGSLAIDKLTIANVALSQARLSLKADAGVLSVAPATANLYEGRFSGDIQLDVNPAIPRLSFNSSLKGVQVEPLFQDATGQARVRGSGDFSAALLTAGGASEALKRNLEGQISMSFNEVAIIGFNLGKHLRQWKRFKAGAPLFLDVKPTEATDLSELSGHAVAQAGVVRMDDLQAKAPAFRLTGKGVLADLRNDAIDYRLDLKVVNTAIGVGGKELSELLGLDLPVNIKGPLEDPKVELDWGRALAALLANELLDLIPLPNVPGILKSDEAKGDKEDDEETGLDPVDKLLKKGLQEIFKKRD